MVRKRKSWREATIVSRLDPDLWRAEYPGGGSGMFREADIRAYDPESDATAVNQPRRSVLLANFRLKTARSTISDDLGRKKRGHILHIVRWTDRVHVDRYDIET